MSHEGERVFRLRGRRPPSALRSPPPPPILHAPDGFGGPRQQPRKGWALGVTVAGLLALGGYAVAYPHRCGKPDPDHPDATQPNCGSGSGGAGAHASSSSGSGARGLSFGGFGDAGAGHGGGG
jgi:hypothetical protein